MRRRRQTTPLELALWRHVVRDVAPLELVEEPALEPPPRPAPVPAVVAAAPAPAKPADARASAGSSPGPRRALRPQAPGANLDRRSWQRLQRGQYPVAARLDLHGLSQAEAHAALCRFVAAEHARGTRCILVITGRGRQSGGILRSEAPRWLATHPMAEAVLAHAPARTVHGGEGALYVLLRRRREA